jgi:hypothetical protein
VDRPAPGGKDDPNIRPHYAPANNRRLSFLVQQIAPPGLQNIFKAPRGLLLQKNSISAFEKTLWPLWLRPPPPLFKEIKRHEKKSLFPLWKEGWKKGIALEF